MFDDVTKKLFWSKVDKSAGDDACWPWTGEKRTSGYGWFFSKYGQYQAHRISLVLKTGQWDMFAVKKVVYNCPSIARHMCDNPVCCNPAHLQWGTPEQNTRDISPEKRAVAVAKAKATMEATGKKGGCANGSEWRRRIVFNNVFSEFCAAELKEGRKPDYEVGRRQANFAAYGNEAGNAADALAADRFELENGA